MEMETEDEDSGMFPDFDMDEPEDARASGALLAASLSGKHVKPLHFTPNSRYGQEPWYKWSGTFCVGS